MVTYVDFVQPQASPMQFQATLDGTGYTITVPWALYGQRYYVNVYRLDGTLVVSIPRIGSPLGYDINLLAGYFTTSTLVFRQPNNQFEIGP